MLSTLNRIRQTSFIKSPTDQALEFWTNLSTTLTLPHRTSVSAPFHIQRNRDNQLELIWLDESEGHSFRIDLTACFLRHQETNPAAFYSLMQLHSKAGVPLADCLATTLTLSRTGAERLILAWGMVEHAHPDNINALCHALIWMDEAQVRTFWEFALHYGMSGRNPTPLYQGLEMLIMGLVNQ